MRDFRTAGFEATGRLETAGRLENAGFEATWSFENADFEATGRLETAGRPENDPLVLRSAGFEATCASKALARHVETRNR